MPWIFCGVWDALFNHHRQRVCSIRGTNCAKMPFMFNVHVWTKERLRQSQRFTYAMDFAPNSNCSNSRQWILCFSTGSISPAELLFGFFFIDWSDWGVQMRVKILHPVKRNVWRRPQCRSHIPVILSIVRCNNSCSFYALRRLSAFSHVANLSLLQCFSMRLIHNSATLSFSFPIFFSFSLLLLFLSRQSLFIFSWKAETNEKINTCQMRRSSKNTHLDTQSTNEQQNKMTYKIRSNKTNKNKMKMKARMKMSGVSQHSSCCSHGNARRIKTNEERQQQKMVLAKRKQASDDRIRHFHVFLCIWRENRGNEFRVRKDETWMGNLGMWWHFSGWHCNFFSFHLFHSFYLREKCECVLCDFT